MGVTSFSLAWRVWFVASSMGILLFLPFLMAWLDGSIRKEPAESLPRRPVESVFAILAMVGTAQFIYGPFYTIHSLLFPNFLVFPFVIWLGIRFGLKTVVTANILWSGIAIWGTLNGVGLYGNVVQPFDEKILSLQVFLIVEILTQLIVFALASTSRQMLTNVKKQERQYQSLVESTPDIIARFDKECRYLFISPAAQAITKIAAEAMVGRTSRELGLPKKLSDFQESMIRQVFQTGKPREGEFKNPDVNYLMVFNNRFLPEKTIRVM
jgi:PAS domain-containing protein